MATAIILIGVPGSGKTTLAQELLQQSTTARIISPDRVRQNLYGDVTIQGDWETIWQQIEREFFQASVDRYSIIYDATNARSQHRREVIALAQRYQFHPIHGWWLNEPLWICLMRNQYRSRNVPEAEIIAMYRALQEAPPQLKEGFNTLWLRQEKNESEWMD